MGTAFRKTDRRNGIWSDKRIKRTKYLIEQGLKLQQIADKFDVSRQAIHAGLKNYPELKTLWDFHKDARKDNSLAKQSRDRHHYKLYKLPYKEFIKLTPAEAKMQRRRVLLWRQKKAMALSAGKDFTIEFEDIKWPTHCPVLGVKLDYYNSVNTFKSKSPGPSFDRFDNTKGYVPGNVNVISYRANWIKSDSSFEEVELLYKYLVKQRSKSFWFSPTSRAKRRALAMQKI